MLPSVKVTIHYLFKKICMYLNQEPLKHDFNFKKAGCPSFKVQNYF